MGRFRALVASDGDDVELWSRNRDARHLPCTASEALARLDRLGDPFAPVLTLEQRLPT